ncbi:MAG: GNAT family N-acetyltransferase [Ignavibacteria bacterium]|jgi:GNAT superfamily N-acetyltransferase|nr:GNAT family N-acetyltransferase [Ignavibacteria bacterium]
MIRRVKQADAEKIERILKKISQFTEKEIGVAMELVNISVNNQTQTDYNTFVFEENGKVLGYHCTGKRPLTDAVYDLYWIIADPESEIKGIGTELVKHAEHFVKEKGARWLLAETSSKESYSKTRNFYLRNSFSIVAEINDFYSAGDNLIVFGKYFK